MAMPFDSNAVRDRSLPAWAISVLIHGSLIAAMCYWARPTASGASEEPLRTVGIVLKRSTEEAETFEGEEVVEEVDVDVEEPKEPTEVAIEPSPEEPAAPKVSVAPPAPAVIGAGTPRDGSLPSPGQSAPGGARWPRIGGGDARVSLFGVEGVGSKFVYVFDRSVSMEGAPLAAAKAQLVRSLELLDRVHRFQIIFFNHRLRIFDATGGQRRIAFATEDNKRRAASFVLRVSADGGTDRFAALRHAISLNPDVIFFLTDIDDPMPASELAQIAALNRRAYANICTIHFGRGPASPRTNFLMHLANESGGQYGYVDTTTLDYPRARQR